jgi:hypothetical protein
MKEASRRLAALSFAALLGGALPASAVQIRVAALDPEPPAVLGEHAPLHLRVGYESDQPLRLQAAAYRGGQKMPGRTNPSPVYPAGEGEALVWTSLMDGEAADEIRITASDARWRPLAEARVAVDVRWSRGAPAREAAEWAKTLGAEQQSRVGADMRTIGGSTSSGPLAAAGSLLVGSLFLSLPGYLLAQVLVLLKFQRGWRLAGAVPLLVMIPVALFSLFALISGSNLWPITMIFASPFGLVYLAVLAVLRRVL